MPQLNLARFVCRHAAEHGDRLAVADSYGRALSYAELSQRAG
jgi:hypothetical protein